MPSQQTTICQQCGEFIRTDHMPAHVRQAHANEQRAAALGYEDVFEPGEIFADDFGPLPLATIGDDGILRPGGVMSARCIDATNASEFNGPYAERGDAIAELLDAVTTGATLEIQGFTLFERTTVRAQIFAAMEPRQATAQGDAIGPVLVDLARKWNAAKP